jgi:hypothetical protein
MRRLRSLAAALSILPVLAAPALSQSGGRAVDQGTFLVTRTGAAQTTESFRIIKLDDGSLQATAQSTGGSRRAVSRLHTDSVGTPIDYRLTVKDAGATIVDVSAAARGNRLSSKLTDQRGDVSMREYPVPNGRCLILGEDLVNEMYFVALAKRSGVVQVIDPRGAHGESLTLSARGLEPIEVAGRSVTATHYSLGSGAAQRDFWIDAAGRLLRVEIGALGLKAAREELPQ